MNAAENESARRYPAKYWPGHEPDGDHPGKLAYLDGVTTDDLRAAFETGAQWQSTQPFTAVQVEEAAKQIYLAASAAVDEYDHWMGTFRKLAVWDDLAEQGKEFYRKSAVNALEAARKALM
ncbi:MAG: hypothetical protein LKI34_02950 [Bifidobacterium tibiigranuli]|jgi:hypothetical protein|uniref:hypothetical protein n=1 Tax=Bifidobacterium tibiigranuli TaxID=2172043 RepID=UPI0026ED384E|nr:hypothetical protein [Bifidobacterium tibiigranuli]MCI1673165.1 hypothetical protein [Bifidobacterium tibiigranuli]MCI1713590.1 hypothetical protein [Bifidobacterium tibiigranuli]